jgi:iron complex outermembrane receptor protein
VGVQNVADKDPVVDPFDPTGRGFDFSLYDGYGRVPYIRYKQTF